MDPIAHSRRTRQRALILEELQKARSHPTADEIYLRVKKRLPRISLGTVYRNLDKLSRSGEILRLECGDRRRYDGYSSDHYHVRCTRCGRVDDIERQIPFTFPAELENQSGYQLSGYQLEFFGVCPQCRDTIPGVWETNPPNRSTGTGMPSPVRL